MKRQISIVTIGVDADRYGAPARHDGDETDEAAVMRLMEHAPQLLTALRRVTHPMASDDDLDDAKALIDLVTGVSLLVDDTGDDDNEG